MVGENCLIHESTIFGTEPYLIQIGNDVRISRGCKLITHDGGLWVLRNKGLVDKKADKFGRIVIGNNVNIGWDVTILPGVTIGDNVVIGVGAVVTKNIPNDSVVAGVPAKVIETLEEYAMKNQEKYVMTKGLPSEKKKAFLLEKMRREAM